MFWSSSSATAPPDTRTSSTVLFTSPRTSITPKLTRSSSEYCLESLSFLSPRVSAVLERRQCFRTWSKIRLTCLLLRVLRDEHLPLSLREALAREQVEGDEGQVVVAVVVVVVMVVQKSRIVVVVVVVVVVVIVVVVDVIVVVEEVVVVVMVVAEEEVKEEENEEMLKKKTKE
ncbi:hypothetical protein E2C01_000510 [Portunus trituberculatus]|uniref:Uncharacterized protein n=1 Tax=Portunus trituberculatus TaxID=210409 RepID=A0A5B7CEA1_PORTR|nr:hypothetical protein [Portunus trituberculatus]